MSSEDIGKGAGWLAEIDAELETTLHGIVCVVPGNETAPWLNYEAGALAKQAGQKRVCVAFLGVNPSDLTGPLKGFQGTHLLEKGDFFKLLATLNGDLGPDSQLKPHQLQHAFDREWPALEERLKVIRDTHTPRESEAPTRTDRELLEEVLALVRNISRASAGIVSSGLPSDTPESALLRGLLRANRGDTILDGGGAGTLRVTDGVLEVLHALTTHNTSARYPRYTPVSHESFGIGVVINSEGAGDDEVASVYFANGIGIKRLLVKYAPFELYDGELPQELRDAIDVL